jgi:uncharacterized membrane protein
MLVLHVLSVIWLASGGFAGAVVRAQNRKAKSLPERVMAIRIANRLAAVYSLPGGILAGISGFGLLHPLGYGFAPGWVKISIVLWLAMLANGIFFLMPFGKKMLAAGEASLAAGAPTPELQALVASAKSRGIASDLNLVGIVVLVLLMILKPF